MNVTLDEALKKCPNSVGLDMLNVSTADDVAYQALHECDMYEEDQDTPVTRRQYNSIKKFLKWCRSNGFSS